jgi:hypothetical protein
LQKKYAEDQYDINFSDKVLGDVKRFIASMLFMVMRFYMPSINNENVLKGSMQEKLMQFITKTIL